MPTPRSSCPRRSAARASTLAIGPIATDLAFGTIRHLRSIDWAIDRVATRPVSRMSPGARNVLRLGALPAAVHRHAAACGCRGDGGPRRATGNAGSSTPCCASSRRRPPRGPKARTRGRRGAHRADPVDDRGAGPACCPIRTRSNPPLGRSPGGAPVAAHQPDCVIGCEGFTDALKEAGRDPQPSLLDPAASWWTAATRHRSPGCPTVGSRSRTRPRRSW